MLDLGFAENFRPGKNNIEAEISKILRIFQDSTRGLDFEKNIILHAEDL